MDCCHSGTGLDLAYEYQLSSRNTYRNHSLNSNAFSQGRWMEDVNTVYSQVDIVLFFGCENSQTSMYLEQLGDDNFVNYYFMILHVYCICKHSVYSVESFCSCRNPPLFELRKF